MVTPAGGAAAALQQPFDDAAERTLAEVYQFPRVEPTAAKQLRIQQAMLEANIAEREARGEKPEFLQNQIVTPVSSAHLDQIRVQSDQSIFSSAFLHIPR